MSIRIVLRECIVCGQTVGAAPDEPNPACAQHTREELLQRIADGRALAEIIGEWLADVDDADDDQPGAIDFYMRVGARWDEGKYHRRIFDSMASRA